MKTSGERVVSLRSGSLLRPGRLWILLATLAAASPGAAAAGGLGVGFGGGDLALTFVGGPQHDFPTALAVDGSGNVYLTGQAGGSWGSPVRPFTPGNTDAFVAKVDASGALLWSTFLGGPGADSGSALVLDPGGNVVVAGRSSAGWGSPVRSYGASTDGFVARLDANGALQWSTFVGGSGFDAANDIVVDGVGNSYVSGQSGASWGSPQRAHTTGFDVFAAQLDPNGMLLWNTFLGGASQNDVGGFGIGVDNSGGVYVTGDSDVSWGSPLRAFVGGTGGDGFVAKLDDGNGSLQWSTFLGGSGYDSVRCLTVDGSGNMVVAGRSDTSWGVPIRAHTGGSDAFAAALDAAGTLHWNTFVGGSGFDNAVGVATDESGNVLVAGSSDASWGSPARPHAGGQDALVAEVDASGELRWNTFLGGSGSDFGTSIAVDGDGTVHVAGESDATWGSPARAFTPGGYDAFVATLEAEAAEPPPPPAGATPLTSTQYLNFRFWVRISDTRLGSTVAGCLPATVCVAGAIPTRAEVFVRIVGPKANGRLWPNVIKFNTTKTELWIEQVSSGTIRYYLLPAFAPDSTTLPGLVDKAGFLP